MTHNPDAEYGTLLIVDDIPANLQLLRSVLEPEGYRILGATSGAAALNILNRTTPDMVLLDVSMPDLDGFEVCRRIKKMEIGANLPVIFITARHESESVIQAFNAGGCDYLTKPFNREEIIVRVRSHLENSRLQRLLAEKNQSLAHLNEELQTRQRQLEEAMANIKTLRGLIPICSYCHKIRDDKGYWAEVEEYLRRNSEARLSHGICPDCIQKHFPDVLLAPTPKPKLKGNG
jgi:PleD family two-component response regulator